MKLIHMPKELVDLDLPEKANLIFTDVFFAFFEMGYVETNESIASKYDISIKTVSRLIKLLEENKLVYRFSRDVPMYGIYLNRVLIPSIKGFEILNIQVDKEWIIKQLEKQKNLDIEMRVNSFKNF
ncbi:MAG: hypothetical protein WC383_17590 [Gammaproteobacteria bacterium]